MRGANFHASWDDHAPCPDLLVLLTFPPPFRYKDGEELLADDHVKLKALPDGTVELTIASVKPTDCGAYKLVATNRNGEKACLSAVAVKRELAHHPECHR